jgi:hypothetical protein
VLNGRYDVDVAPAGFQTYFNPAVYFPVYYLRHWLPSPCGLVIMGALHGLNLALIYWLTRVLLPKQASVWPVTAALLIAAVGGRHQLRRHSDRAAGDCRLHADPLRR